MGRKIKEAILATRLEQALTKRQILELYLNEIWLGHRQLRRRRGTYNYFGRSISDLSLAQCAFLAALQGTGQHPPATSWRPSSGATPSWRP